MNDITKAAIEITGLGMAGIFLFMVIFYFVIKVIDKFFPAKPVSE
jgi:Na+-transporting methylmalonyl-CoA/oxaloacetate decarboxylase gamma subunit